MDIGAGPFEVPWGKPARGRVVAPPSKSHAIRALVCAALAEGESSVSWTGGPLPQDTLDAIAALRALGVAIDEPEPQWLQVHGTRGVLTASGAVLDVGGSGTALRVLAAVAALGAGPTTVTGNASLRSRPAGAIVPALRSLGVSVDAACGPRGMVAPLVVSGGPPSRAEVEVDASESSHALSALLLVGPVLPHGLIVRPLGGVSSRPYVELTVWAMRRFGDRGDDAPRVEWRADAFHVAPRPYDADGARFVGDWSSAAYLLAAGAVAGGDVEGIGLDFESPQADRRVLDVLASFGAGVERGAGGGVRVRGCDRRSLDVDLRDAPDLAPLVGALGCVATGTTRVRGAAHLRIKESDRIATVVAAARALGCEATELPDGFEIVGPAKHGGLVDTHHDHRIAMAFAVAGLAIPGVVIDDPACVVKSYPGFWDDLARLTGG